VVAEAVAYVLVLTKVMGNWWFVLATVAVAVAVPALGRVVRPDAFRTGAVTAPPAPGRPAAQSVAVGSAAAVEGVADARS
jgi:hypothetical protein